MGQYYKYENQTPGHRRNNLASTATQSTIVTHGPLHLTMNRTIEPMD